MVLFLSTTTNKIDKKGRVSVPSTFRAALEKEAFQGVVLIPSQNHLCLEGFAYSSMQDIARRLDEFDMFSAEQEDLASIVFGEAVQLSFDKEGRITLSEELMARANLDENAIFVGMGSKFQIWNEGAYNTRRHDARKNAQEKKLTIPKATGGAL